MPTVTANAATWHKGLPKIIRNKMYQTKLTFYNYGPGDYTWYKGTQSVLTTHRTQSGTATTLLNTKYRKVGKTYFIKGLDKWGTAIADYSEHPGKVYSYVRIRKINNKEIRIARGKKATKYDGEYMTMHRFYHFYKINGHEYK